MTKPQNLSLFELNSSLKRGVKELFPDNYWVIGEISEMNMNQSGHCYLEIIEKAENTDQIIARAKATIWAFTFRMLKPYFESVTGQKFAVGLKVLLQVSIEFHEVYGYSLNIKDIQPDFTVGDLTRKRQEIIKRLQDEGVFSLNREVDFPMVPQRIAVISSETAAGYGDFVNQLTNNIYNYKYHIQLFNAYMQGENAEQSIIDALDQIYSAIDRFDIVVIIRGGGSQADLNCFNSYWLCYHITQFPIAIITGIGHERDETIADLVAHANLKTPTAVAGFIIDKTNAFETSLQELSQQVMETAWQTLDEFNKEISHHSQRLLTIAKLSISAEKQRINALTGLFKNEIKNAVKKNRQILTVVTENIRLNSNRWMGINNKLLEQMQKKVILLLKSLFLNERHKFEEYTGKINLLDPVHILKRGYTLTFYNGLLIKNVEKLKPGDIIDSKWHSGTARSEITQIKPRPAN